jgi:predicted enzyme related to lactoylglutathione lyase
MRKITFYIAVLINAVLASIVSFSQVNKVETIGITVKDMNRSLTFYTRVLGFKKISDAEFSGDQIETLKGTIWHKPKGGSPPAGR